MNITNDTLEELQTMAHSLEINTTGRFLCPVCNGGTTHERSLSINRKITKAVMHCYRTSCALPDVFTINTRGIPTAYDSSPTKRTRREQWDGKVLPAPPDWWELEPLPSNLRFNMTEDSRIIIPILDRTGNRRGDCVRQLRPYNDSYPKALSLYEEEYDGMAWYRPDDDSPEALAVVEDAISAIRLACNGVVGVALLGTGLNSVRLRELAAEGMAINLVLDADATLTAVRMARKFGSISMLHVHRIFRDVKDMDDDELWNFLDALVV